MKYLIPFALLMSFNLIADECSVQGDFYGTLPLFMGVEGTMEFTSRGLKVVDRGNGLKTVKVSSISRYFYPGERKETYILREDVSDDETTLTAAPKLFDCNLRQVVMKKNKIKELSECNLEGCRQFSKQICDYLVGEIKADKLSSVLESLSKIESEIANLSIYTNIVASSENLLKENKRGLGATLKQRSYLPELSVPLKELPLSNIKTAAHLIEEKEYCEKLLKGNEFYRDDFRPSKYIPKQDD